MGTPSIACVHLKKIFDDGYPLLAVVAQPDKPQGRGMKLSSPACAIFAKEKNIPLYQPQTLKDGETTKLIQKLAPDFIVVVAYGKLLPNELIAASKIDTVNIHASLLPKLRGAAPIQWAIVNGDKTTGMTLMKITEKMDSGPIYAQAECMIEDSDTAETLFNKLAPVGAELLSANLSLIADGKLNATSQDEGKVTLAPILKKEDGLLDWQVSAREIFNKIRGFNPWPGAYTFIDNKRLKIYDSQALNDQTKASPGEIYAISPQGIFVACKGSSLLIKEVQLEGKNKMKATDFANGVRLQTGTQFKTN